MSMRNRLTGVFVLVAATASWAGPANAAPSSFEAVTISCPGRGDEAFVSPGADFSFTPGFFGDTHELLVPYLVSYTITSNGVSSGDTIVKSAPVPDDAITCTVAQIFHFGGVTYELAGTIVGVVEGQPSG